MKTVDIIVPCYNEQEMLMAFFEETEKCVNSIEGYSFNYIFVNDGSKDNTLSLLRTLANRCERVKYISFSRNFGKEAAMYAGLSNSSGDYTIVMDADLQHPPALIPDMIAGINEGYDCVAAYRTTRTNEKPVRSFLSRCFYNFNNRITNVSMPQGAVDFRIMSKQMVRTIVNMPESQRFSKGLFSWIGFEIKWIPYENVERAMGETKWTMKSLFRYAIDGITSFSVAPLRMLSLLGAFISLIAFVYAIFILFKTLIFGIDSPGYASIIIIVLFLGGIIELSLGIIGEYLSRIFVESKGRPIYIERESNIVNDTISKEANKISTDALDVLRRKGE